MAYRVQAVVLFCLLIGASTACVSRDRAENPNPLPLAAAVAESTPATVSAASIATLSPSPTPVPPPAMPTVMSVRIETPTPPAELVALPAPQAGNDGAGVVADTVPVVAADPAPTVVAVAEPRILARYPSPDRVLEAVVRIYDCTQISPDEAYAYEELLIRQRNVASEQKAASQLRFCGGLGAYGLEGLVWSPNGIYFYYTTAREGMPDGCGAWSHPVIRYDIISGANVDLGYGAPSPNAVSLAVWQDGRLNIYNLSGTTPHYSIEPAIPGMTEGPVVWSPDSQTLAYMLSDSWCPGTQSALVLVDVSTGRQRIVADELAQGFNSISWPTLWRIMLVDDAGMQWVYAVDTDSMAPAQ